MESVEGTTRSDKFISKVTSQQSEKIIPDYSLVFPLPHL